MKDYRTFERSGHVTSTWFARYYDETFAQGDMELLEIAVMNISVLLGYKTMNELASE